MVDTEEARPLVIDSRPEISLADYIQQAWPVLEPSRSLVWNWHLDDLCRVLEEISLGERTRLIINIPPGLTKSMTVCVMWPTWEWTWLPQSRWLFYSFNEQFSTRDAVKSRRLIQSRWYQRRWGLRFSLTSDQNEKKRYENDRTGFRLASGFGGSVTGERGDRVVIDDSIKADEGRNENKLADVNQTFDEAISTRLNEPARSAIVVIQHRVAARDLPGHLLERGGWDHLALPMEYELPPEDRDGVPPALRNWSTVPVSDPRTQPGELLDAERYPRPVVDAMKVTLGSFATAAQFQQRPVPAGGGIFKAKWFGYWEPQGESYGPVRLVLEDGAVHTALPCKLPKIFTGVLQSHDLTFSGETSAAVSDVYAWIGVQRVFLLDELRTFGEFTAQVEQIRRVTEMWPAAGLKLVEAKANGMAAISTLRLQIPGLVPVQVTDQSKAERYDAVSPFVEAGHCSLPHPDMPGYAWVRDWVTEVCAAPYGTYDDRADTLTMALARIFLATLARRRNGQQSGSRIHSALGM